MIIKKSDDFISKCTYYYLSKRINYVLVNKNKVLISKFDYDVPNNSLNCIKGSCKNYHVKVNYILSIYRELNKTLQ